MKLKAFGLALLLFALAALFPMPGGAVLPDEVLDDPALEARARELSREIRCLVCQNESIDSSNAELARDLRILVRERLTAGDSDQQVLDYLVARYGDYVLLRPPVKPATYLLWFGPALLLLLGGAAVVRYFRPRRGNPPAAAAPLSDHERTRLKALLEKSATRDSPDRERLS